MMIAMIEATAMLFDFQIETVMVKINVIDSDEDQRSHMNDLFGLNWKSYLRLMFLMHPAA